MMRSINAPLWLLFALYAIVTAARQLMRGAVKPAGSSLLLVVGYVLLPLLPSAVSRRKRELTV